MIAFNTAHAGNGHNTSRLSFECYRAFLSVSRRSFNHWPNLNRDL